VAVLTGLACASTGSDSHVAAPDFGRIDYAHPEKYLAVDPALASPEMVVRIASEIRGETPEEKLREIGAWIDAHLQLRETDAYVWRNVDQLLADGTYGGCADHAVAFGSIARAVGIPTVWVKTMDADWIREFVRAGMAR
jgi:transglutaminase-like putative cysteine protease